MQISPFGMPLRYTDGSRDVAVLVKNLRTTGLLTPHLDRFVPRKETQYQMYK